MTAQQQVGSSLGPGDSGPVEKATQLKNSTSPSSSEAGDSRFHQNATPAELRTDELSPFRVGLAQCLALTKKNWIILARNWFVNIFRCLIIPIAYYIFLGEAKNFLITSNDLGLGDAVSVRPLADTLSSPLYWLQNTNTSTQGAAAPFGAAEVMDVIISAMPADKQSLIRRVESDIDLGLACPQAFNGLSSCFGAVEFTNFTSAGQNLANVAYNLRFDPGLDRVEVSTNTGDAEKRILPLQWAVDSAIIQLNGGRSFAEAQQPDGLPRERPFTEETNEEQSERQRTGFLDSVRSLTVLAFFVSMLGVVWHMPSSISEERGSGMTALLTTMGCGQGPRITSWMLGPGLAYLPAWFVMGGSLSATLWTNTNAGLAIFSHVLPGLALATWSMFVGTFFARANISSVVTTALAILFAIVALLCKGISEVGGVIIGLLFPSASFVFEFIRISDFEVAGMEPEILNNSGTASGVTEGPSILGQILAQLVGIVLFPLLTVMLERKLYYADSFIAWLFKRQPSASLTAALDEKRSASIPALEIKGLVKRYSKKEDSLAVDNLDLVVPRGSITCLLGSNGSGKSTTIGVVGGTIRRTSGEVLIEGQERSAAPPGTIGVCPQKNVLYKELTCVQHVEMFRAIKHRYGPEEDAEELLTKCELTHKLKSKPGQLSGGQKRRLQTALALVGQSTFLMFDEATSGLDPLSRRAIWKILLAQRGQKSVLFTSHFLDEADLLGDRVTILAAPGKKLCEGSPVELKQKYGDGSYLNVITVDSDDDAGYKEAQRAAQLKEVIGRYQPDSQRIQSITPGEISFLIPTTDPGTLAAVLGALEQRKAELGIESYDIAGPSLESVFLKLNSQHARSIGRDAEVDELERSPSSFNVNGGGTGALSDGSVASVWRLTLAQLRKRGYIFKRAWFPPIAAVLVAVLGSIVPLVFFSNSRDPSCNRGFLDQEVSTPSSFFDFFMSSYPEVLFAPQGALQSTFGQGFPLDGINFTELTSAAWTENIEQNYRNITFGGVDFPPSQVPTLAYLADDSLAIPIAMMNLVSNAQLASARSTGTDGGPLITASYRFLSQLSLGSGLGEALKWAVIFGLVQAVFPAFAALYPAAERNNRAKAMMLTNGMRALPFWLGHLLAELPVMILASVPVALVYAFVSDQFAGVGVFWVTLFLYALAATLQSFVVSLFAPNQLAAFAIMAAWNVLAFLIYFASTMLTVTYYVGYGLAEALDTVYYVEAILSPSVSMTRAGFVSVNLFNLLCNGNGGYKDGGISSIDRLGAPVLYVLIWSAVLFGILLYVDSGFSLLGIGPGRWGRRRPKVVDDESRGYEIGEGVAAEAARLDCESCEDLLKASHLSKSYGKLVAVDDVSLGVRQGETVALLGINGGGKTTTHALIRGELRPDEGRVTIAGVDVARERTVARSNIASVPQFDGLDPTLTVREHLNVYARIKGIPRSARKDDIATALEVTNLTTYAWRQAGALSGGNMRKLSLALALLGNPAVLLLDELSSGVDSWTKRGLWQTLRRVGAGRATLITTHSMEEAQALASRVAIQASRLLALGTVPSLRRTHPAYELQIAATGDGDCDSFVHTLFPSARTSDEASARYEIPLTDESVADIFAKLERAHHERARAGVLGYSVAPVSLESLFLHIVRKAQSHAAADEMGQPQPGSTSTSTSTVQ